VGRRVLPNLENETWSEDMKKLGAKSAGGSFHKPGQGEMKLQRGKEK